MLVAPSEGVRALAQDVRRAVRDITDFPKPGIVFKDITPVLADAALFRRVTDAMAAPYVGDGITHVVAIESRGFILGAPVAQQLRAGFIPMRKPGKLPFSTVSEEYLLEYGSDRLEIHSDAWSEAARVLLVDDVLATGGTASAAARLAEKLGARVVACSFLIALSFLPGLQALHDRRVSAIVTY
jgi:adenine phosphoribosyltransferase